MGLIVRAMGDCVAFCPPLIITEDEINEMFDIVEKGLDIAWKSGCATKRRPREGSMSTIEEKQQLRAKLGEVGELAAGKTLPKLDKYAKTYIARSPFLCIGTADADGNADCLAARRSAGLRAHHR